MQNKYKVWSEYNCDEEDASEVSAWDEIDAAVEHAEARYADYDYPEVMELNVRDVQTQTLYKIDVYAEPDIIFRGVRK